MKFVLKCIDKEGALDVRLATRDAHVAYLKASELVEQAGPLVDAEGKMYGSVIILEAENREQIETFAQNDPYQDAGLFESVEIHAWNRVIG